MKKRIITTDAIAAFKKALIENEKSEATIDKYVRDVTAFMESTEGTPITKDTVIAYKHKIAELYAVRSVNSMLSSINSFFEFMEWYDCKVKTIKIQNEIYRSEEKDLTEDEYRALVKTAEDKGDIRLSLILQTICSTGIRIGELSFITVRAAKRGEAIVKCKGKTRKVFLLPELCKLLLAYAEHNKILKGPVFLGKNGKPIHRTTVWREMKALCKTTGIPASKVFPHNLRHVFAKVFYKIEKDIAKLADILGHSSINTTRIYIMTTGDEHRKKIEQMKLLLTQKPIPVA